MTIYDKIFVKNLKSNPCKKCYSVNLKDRVVRTYNGLKLKKMKLMLYNIEFKRDNVTIDDNITYFILGYEDNVYPLGRVTEKFYVFEPPNIFSISDVEQEYKLECEVNEIYQNILFNYLQEDFKINKTRLQDGFSKSTNTK